MRAFDMPYMPIALQLRAEKPPKRVGRRQHSATPYERESSRYGPENWNASRHSARTGTGRHVSGRQAKPRMPLAAHGRPLCYTDISPAQLPVDERGPMHLEHVALYVEGLEGARSFFCSYLDGASKEPYHNPKTGLSSSFVAYGTTSSSSWSSQR